MNIKTAIVAGAFSVLAIGASGFPECMAATLSNHSGIICKNYNASEATVIDYLTWGTRSYATYSTYVICPLVRRTTLANGAIAYVDVRHYGAQVTSCTLHSYKVDGSLLGSIFNSTSGDGYKRITLNLKGANKSNKWSDYSVLCVIPGNAAGTVMGIDLEEY